MLLTMPLWDVYPHALPVGGYPTYDLRPVREPHFEFVCTESLAPIVSTISA